MRKQINLPTNLQNHFFSNKKSQEKILVQVLQLGYDFYSGKARGGLVLQYKTPKELLRLLPKDVPRRPQGLKAMLKDLELVGAFSIAQCDKNYLAFPDSGNSMVGLAAGIINKFINQNLIAFDRSAPIATIIEVQLLGWLRKAIGYEARKVNDTTLADVGGMATSGGHMSNHIAILTALTHRFPGYKKNGLTSLKKRPVILLAKKVAHYSLEVACHHLGLGLDSVIEIPATSNLTTDYRQVEDVVNGLPEDVEPFMLVTTAGNPRTSSIDDIASLAKISKKLNLWLHVDACHGGSLLFSNKLKKRMEGIEQADSISLDPHKGLFLPYPTSFVLFKDPQVMVAFSRYPDQVKNGTSWDIGLIICSKGKPLV